ncbi:hypothetical protein GA0070622_1213 [Micromonospora sediminicola]|uniref:Transcriptional regulator PadR-like family protein n=1 Tax=Micromonospora sediminicola TaxID=946078 RepID=A0A1A9B566_9ACTN|nr:hypothetical protein [Micromonospora sediminicola]SBT64243.1 hypothetical protein GA0070622_1213 [Micromonospora sediminicola]
MRITLDEPQVDLLAAVDAGNVHTDPRFTLPDFERVPGEPGHRRATQRLQPLKDYRLVELDPDTPPDRWGVRPYRLTGLGERVLAEAREQEAADRAGEAEPAASGPDR